METKNSQCLRALFSNLKNEMLKKYDGVKKMVDV